MKDSYFNIVVKKILKFKNKIINSEKIKLILENILDQKYTIEKLYKIIYYLKNKGFLLPLKKDIYYVTELGDDINKNSIIEHHYWEILSQHCKDSIGSDRYIGSLKALELNISDFSIPDDIMIINPYKQAKEVVLENKYLNFKKYSNNNISIFKKLKKFSKNIKIKKNTFKIANLELAILESLYSPNIITTKYSQELIKKILRKYKKDFNRESIKLILKLGKHHTSINRLYSLAKSIDPDISKNIADIIKKYSFFLTQ